MSQDLESELRAALRPIAPSASFEKKLIASVTNDPQHSQPKPDRRGGAGWHSRTRWLSLAAAACLLIGLGLDFYPAATAAPQSGAQSFPHPAIWRVHHGQNTLYLFGSLHILPNTLSWKSPEVDAAMRASEVFMFEVPVDAQTLAAEKDFILRNGILPRGASLRAALSPDEYRIYSTILKGAGLNPQLFDRYRPWLASVMVGLAYLHRQDFTNLKGADDVLIAYARSQKKQLRYFESMEQQLGLLTRIDDTVQIKALKDLIESLPQAREHEAQLVESWARGDANRLAGLIDNYFVGHPDAKKLLVDDRNRAWLPRIKDLIDSGSTALVTVGAAHIGGDTGLLQDLCAEGYEVERLGDEGAPSAKVCGPGA